MDGWRLSLFGWLDVNGRRVDGKSIKNKGYGKGRADNGCETSRDQETRRVGSR